MKPILFAIVLAFSLNVQQDTPEDYPGQSRHERPPADWFCSHDAKDGAHKCECQRVASNCDEEPAAPQCKVYCHEQSHWVEDGNGKGHLEPSHCHCPIADQMCGKHK